MLNVAIFTGWAFRFPTYRAARATGQAPAIRGFADLQTPVALQIRKQSTENKYLGIT
jgi:hypothetical protein